MSFKSVFFAFLAASMAFSGMACAAPKKEEKAEKQAILITAFGTSMPSARKAIDNLVASAKKAFPGADVRLAFSSNIIRRKLAREGKKNVPPTPVQALAALNDEGFKNVCVMPTHIIPGAEYDEIKNVVDAWNEIKGKYGFKDLRMGKTFLSSVEGCDEMADILIKRFAKVPADTAVVLMGHGTPHHIANAMYSQLQVALNKKAGFGDGIFLRPRLDPFFQYRDWYANLEDIGLKISEMYGVSDSAAFVHMKRCGLIQMEDPEDMPVYIRRGVAV